MLASAGAADRGVRVIDFLNHGADQAGELGHLALEDRFAEIDVAEHAVERIGVIVVGRAGKQAAGEVRPVVRGRDGEGFLAGEVVEEGALVTPAARHKSSTVVPP